LADFIGRTFSTATVCINNYQLVTAGGYSPVVAPLTWVLSERIMRFASAKSSFEPTKCSTPRGRTARFPGEQTQSENETSSGKRPDEEASENPFLRLTT
jgi:hypothetical protein